MDSLLIMRIIEEECAEAMMLFNHCVEHCPFEEISKGYLVDVVKETTININCGVMKRVYKFYTPTAEQMIYIQKQTAFHYEKLLIPARRMYLSYNN